MEVFIKNMAKDLNEKLQAIEQKETDFFKKVPAAIDVLEDAFLELKTFISDYTFRDEDEEIRFFKELKPQLFCKLISTVYVSEIVVFWLFLVYPNGQNEMKKTLHIH